MTQMGMGSMASGCRHTLLVTYLLCPGHCHCHYHCPSCCPVAVVNMPSSMYHPQCVLVPIMLSMHCRPVDVSHIIVIVVKSLLMSCCEGKGWRRANHWWQFWSHVMWQMGHKNVSKSTCVMQDVRQRTSRIKLPRGGAHEESQHLQTAILGLQRFQGTHFNEYSKGTQGVLGLRKREDTRVH